VRVETFVVVLHPSTRPIAPPAVLNALYTHAGDGGTQAKVRGRHEADHLPQRCEVVGEKPAQSRLASALWAPVTGIGDTRPAAVAKQAGDKYRTARGAK